ncbi:IS5 family transposase [Brevibacillus composti]|uniref:IS5 family transposase n=1 Tax=Brevibacillus composti TaxID=2796470 RepID=A0A7T5JMX8_9BACL|nr:IS5 family transposase [Brevibacillus composti]QQE73440.1 IS5 family transposase [Brevibacillus composti]QUO40522.1 IS5 family transposase [Brevibacillus composti]
MYQYVSHRENQLLLPDDFFLPFGGKLNKENRWAKLAQLVPWAYAEGKYAKSFRNSFRGQKAVSIRVALGALIIQERLQLSDRETVQQIVENPYLQYFIGLEGYQDHPPFHPSLMTHFRKRLGEQVLREINEIIAVEAAKSTPDSDHDDEPKSGTTSKGKRTTKRRSTSEEDPNQGVLLLDATCAPADVAYPTDLNLLNEAREKLEEIIDTLHAPQIGRSRKPRTYRDKARKEYLAVAKQRRANGKVIRRAIGKQLRYVARNLQIIRNMASRQPLTLLSRKQYRDLLVIQELYRQQRMMFERKTHQIEDRIVSIHQPHVRPVVRGKAKARVEFGAKVSVSMVNGYAFLERLSWDSFNEGVTLIESVEAYKRRFGCYPKAVLADQIYRTRQNRAFCKAHGIRLSGPALGRPVQGEEATEQRRVARQDARKRNAIEGKFGEGKRRYGLGRIRACLAKTSETVIALQLLVMNLERRLRDFFVSWLNRLLSYRIPAFGNIFEV